jgi:trk system potassium uptake protein
MYMIVVGAGKVGWNLGRELLEKGHEVTLVEKDRNRYLTVEQELEHSIQYGDATELWVLERAGISRADMVIAVTGDDEDNLVIGQLSREKYQVERVIARVNDPRNQQLFDLLEIPQTVSATQMVLGLIEHEVPAHELIHLLELKKENLEIVEVEVESGAPAAGKRVDELALENARLISVLRGGKAEIAVGSTMLEAGDQVLAILEPGQEDDLRRLLLKR